MKVTDSLIG